MMFSFVHVKKIMVRRDILALIAHGSVAFGWRCDIRRMKIPVPVLLVPYVPYGTYRSEESGDCAYSTYVVYHESTERRAVPVPTYCTYAATASYGTVRTVQYTCLV